MTKGVSHSLFDDVQAILLASLFMSFGVALFTQQEFLIGGTAGVAFLGSYASSWSFGQLFFVINIPFYGLALWRLGWFFTLKTFVAVGLVSILSDWIPQWIVIDSSIPLFAAIFGGSMMGAGLLMLFRHKASLGGLNILSLYLSKYHNVNAGRFQMMVDVVIIILAIYIVDIWATIYSVIAAICMNAVLAINFKKGRYLASLDS
ncbi:YitT family protein [Balneolaceae bacterium]|nr:YitT family protein [Balneolaceae bacterium]